MKKKYLGLKQQFLLLSLCSGSLMASPCQSAPTIPGFIGNTADVLPPIPVTALPTGGTAIRGIDSIREINPAQMEITQNKPKAVIHWQTFNIGEKASVNFNQQGNAGWAALNAIGDASPSQIHGKLTADGAVYLINQNGIFFGPTAQVNVRSLTASSLNLTSSSIIKEFENISVDGLTDNKIQELKESASAFVNGYSNTTAQTITFRNAVGTAGASVENSGSITAADGGQVFLIGGKAVNSGSIKTNNGMVAMAAGDEVILDDLSSNVKRFVLPVVTTSGVTAEVNNSGLLQADEGIVGLYGGIVNQNGRAIATSAISRNGQIELKAHTRVSTGAGSVTATPVTASTERQTPSEDFVGGLITVNAKEFIHQGAISSPGGTVTIKDSLLKNDANTGLVKMERIRLESGSSIDVSGLWVDQTAEDRILEVQLNSDTLKDAYALKDGLLLGETVRIDILNGMPAADISAYLLNRPRSAAELLTEGGSIELDAVQVEIAAGSSIDISGGGYNYSAGDLDLTMVRVGNSIKYLSDLAAGTPVDEVMGSFTRNHERYGIRESWNGLYYGGASPLSASSPAFFQGSNGGRLTITTPYLFMAGILDGWAERGLYQTEVKDKRYANGNILALGRSMPKGGTLAVGGDLTATSAETAAANVVVTHAISMVSTALAAPEEDEWGMSYIPSEIINNAGLSALELHAATTFTVDQGVEVHLAPGGSFNASARQIEVNGSIQAAGGSITLETQSNKTSFTRINNVDNPWSIPLEESLTIGSTAVLDAAGESINNTGGGEMAYGYTKGGTITLSNRSTPSAPTAYENPDHGYDLTVAAGSRLSVQGGYWQNSSGSTKGGDGGSLLISQKITEEALQELPDNLHLTIDGELAGHALLGSNGGSLTIEAHEMTIFPAAGMLNNALDSIVFDDNRFARTGFSSISLSTYGDLTVTSGSHLETSTLRRSEPFSLGTVQPIGLLPVFADFVNALPLEAGDTMIALKAGTIADKDLTIEAGAAISVAPKGKISLTASGLAAIGGTLEAPAGTIEITGQEVTVQGSARLLAQGVNLELPGAVGPNAETNWKMLDGGTVSLDATFGSLAIESGSLIDVSGSPVVSNAIEDNLGDYFHRSEAGSPGSISLAFYDTLTLDGVLTAESSLPGLSGGTLTFKRTHNTEPLAITKSLAQSSQQPGFDDLHFVSVAGIDFSESTVLSSNRRLVLDAPQIISSGGAATLDAPWVQIVNHQTTYTGNLLPATNNPAQVFSVHADFLDITGNVRFNGFSTTSLMAEQAIRLSDWYYGGAQKWSGKLAVSGDLTLQANVVYPTTGSIFSIDSPGLISILPGQDTSASPVFSAGGDLTITGHDIFHAGTIAAPMGKITLKADQGRVLLTPESRLSVSGSENVAYGTILQGIWKILDKAGALATTTKKMTLPEPSINVSGHELLITEGARIEADGGGSVSAYEFLPGFDGTANPLLSKNRLIIVPNGSVSLPELGEIFLEGNAAMGLAEGVYSILPTEYAFLPGALILERGSSGILPGQEALNLLQQPIIAGYEKAFGSTEKPAAMTGYVLRAAADVLTEGNFDRRTELINNGGNITISGDTLIMLGGVSAAGAGNGKDGALTLAGTHINYASVPEGLRALKTMEDIIPAGFIGSAWFDNNLTSGNAALGQLTLGDYDPKTNSGRTKTVTFAPGQTLSGIAHVIIKAKDSITVNENSTIQALATNEEEGILELTTANLITRPGSLLHASDELDLNITAEWDFSGDWIVDDGRIHLISSLFSIGSDSSRDPGTGLFITQDMLNAFTSVKELWIESKTDIRFVDNINLATSGSLLLDSQRLLFKDVDAVSLQPYQVTIDADILRLRNTHDASAAVAAAAVGDHSLRINARELTLGPGTVRVDGFTDVNLTPAGNLFFEGQGEFQAMLPDSGTLTMTAAAFQAAFPQDIEPLAANSFSVSSGSGEVIFQDSGISVPTTSGAPGSLNVTGRSVTMDGALLNFPGGSIALEAKGTGVNDQVLLTNGAQLLARGSMLHHSLGLNDASATVDFQLPGGEVLLTAANGQVVFEDNGNGKNLIDVSATDNQNGGRVTIKAANSLLHSAALTLLGGGGVGGSLDLITRALPELGELATALSAGGFTNELRIQAREDDISLAAGRTLTARSITLAADGVNDASKGKITIAGTVDSSGTTGGEIHLYANQDLTLAAGGRIEAKGTNGDGGEVVLSSDEGFVRTDAGSTIDTTGTGSGIYKDGSVTFRTDLTETSNGGTTSYDVKLDAQGTIHSGEKNLQAVKSYDYVSGTSITSAQLGNISLVDPSTNIAGTWIGDSYRFIAGLSGYKAAGYTLLPEIEIRSIGDLTLAGGFQTGSGATLKGLERWRPDGLPGVLSFRAGGNLNVNTNITDVPTSLNTATVKFRDINPDGKTDSWALNFIAGADLSAADPLSASAAKDLTIGTTGANNVVVYSESGDITLAAGQDIKIMTAGSTPRDYMPGVYVYTLATFDGDIVARAGRDLNLGPVIIDEETSTPGGGILQSAIGDINIATSGDVLLEGNGAIRTTGRMPTWAETDPALIGYHINNNSPNFNANQTSRYRRFWEYRDGGDITMRTGGEVKGTMDAGTNENGSNGWEGAYKDFVNSVKSVDEKGVVSTIYDFQWSANYGNMSSFSNYTLIGTSTIATHGIATMGGGNITIETGENFLAQTGAFGLNNEASLTILARGNLDGRFLAMQGDSLLSTLGSFGTTTIGSQKQAIATSIGIGDVALTVQAMGSTEIGSISNPTLANNFSQYPSASTDLQSRLTYGADSSVDIAAMHGSALLTGTSNYQNFSDRYRVLPGNLSIRAAQDIAFSNEFIMAPSPQGGLTLLAGEDIQGRYAGDPGQMDNSSSLTMSDAGMEQYLIRTDNTSAIIFSLTNNHSNPPLHQNDIIPVHIEAGRDIAKINFTTPKETEIIAGRDLLNITYLGQNLRANDASILSAGRDFIQSEVIGINKPSNNDAKAFMGITQAGPGSLLIQAGNNLDLANSSGVQTIGSSLNSALQDPNIPLDANGRVKGSDLTVIVGYDIRPTAGETADFLNQLKEGAREVSALIAAGKESEAAILKEKIRAEIFSPFLYDHRSGTGDLNMTTSSLQTISGKDAINIFANGDVNVGVTTIASADSTTVVGDKETGIFTAGGGAINLIAGQDVNVNESRVMTFLGGDIVVLSDEGDINAGRGSKAKVTAAEPQIVTDPETGAKSVIFSPPAVGSGLRTLAYDPDGTGPRVTPEPGDMYVVAWDGVVDAGEAGIEGGRLYLAATQVLNSQNISVGAGSVGVPATSGAPVSLGALSGDSMAATESTTSDIAKNTAGAGDRMADTAKKIADTISQLRFFVVKFLGFIE
ncbi:MAG: filamentous hemagglutinin family outer membrane [Desulfobulbaceae bacterium]|nr:MAG: filamentous hemagglutinin family outer membrane [Desulfobulbaceae bacterium]